MSFLNLGGLTVKATRFARMPDIEGRGGRRYTINGQYRGIPDWRKRGWSGELFAETRAEYGAVMARVATRAPITVSGDALDEGDYLMETFGEIPPGISASGPSIVEVPGTAGGTVLQVSGAYRSWYPDMARALPWDTETLYRFEVRMRIVQDDSEVHEDLRFYAGVRAMDAAGTVIPHPTGNQNRYIVANGTRPSQSDGWITYTGWLRGLGTQQTTNSADNPSGLEGGEDAAWIAPSLLINWSNPTDQVTQIDYVRVEAVDPPAASAGILAYVEQPSDAQYERDGKGWFHRIPVTVREV